MGLSVIQVRDDRVLRSAAIPRFIVSLGLDGKPVISVYVYEDRILSFAVAPTPDYKYRDEDMVNGVLSWVDSVSPGEHKLTKENRIRYLELADDSLFKLCESMTVV